jgi:hypothetical protein
MRNIVLAILALSLGSSNCFCNTQSVGLEQEARVNGASSHHTSSNKLTPDAVRLVSDNQGQSPARKISRRLLTVTVHGGRLRSSDLGEELEGIELLLPA